MILGCIIIGIVLAYFLVERQKEADSVVLQIK